MQNYVQTANSIDTVLANTVRGGDVVVLQDIVGVAASDSNGVDPTTVVTAGVFELPKKSTDNIAQGKTVYWDATNKEVTTTVGTNILIGFAWNASGASVTNIRVALKNG